MLSWIKGLFAEWEARRQEELRMQKIKRICTIVVCAVVLIAGAVVVGKVKSLFAGAEEEERPFWHFW
jgi:hypothetical protein